MVGGARYAFFKRSALQVLPSASAALAGSFMVHLLPCLGSGNANPPPSRLLRSWRSTRSVLAFRSTSLRIRPKSSPSLSPQASATVVNTSQQMGGALGLAALVAVAAAYTTSIAGPWSDAVALNAGFLAGAGCVVLGTLIAASLLHCPTAPARDDLAHGDAGPSGSPKRPRALGSPARRRRRPSGASRRCSRRSAGAPGRRRGDPPRGGPSSLPRRTAKRRERSALSMGRPVPMSVIKESSARGSPEPPVRPASRVRCGRRAPRTV